MQIFADLHIHSRFSRATSKDITIQQLEKWAKIKGIDLLGTGDFTHPLWLKELKENLTEDGSGFLKTKTGFTFALQTEISLIYSQADKGRRIHLIVLAPSFSIVDQINDWLSKKGRLDYDGRPIFNISCPEFVEKLKAISKDIEIIPAHCLPPDELVHTKNGAKEIKKLRENEEVLTHKGRFRRVKKIYVRNFEGIMLKIIPSCLKESTNLTPEHPVYVIKSYKECKNVPHTICKPTCAYLKRGCKLKKFKEYTPAWILAKDVEVGDIILYPIYNEIKNKKFIHLKRLFPEFHLENGYVKPKSVKAGVKNIPIKNKIRVSKEFCRLIGYYLAEGYITRDKVSFTFNEDEKDYVNEVKNLMFKVFGRHIKIYEEKEKSKGISFSIHSKVLCKFFSLFYSSKPYRAFNKKLPSWMMALPIEKQKEILLGWWRGDSGYTTSKVLANQMKMIFLRLGIVPAITKIHSKDVATRRLKNPNVILGRRIIPRHDCYHFHNLSVLDDKARLLECKEFVRYKTKLSRRKGWIDNNFVYLPVIRIEKRRFAGKVYNLEVEEDNSYVTEALAVHNCWTPWFGVFGSKTGFDSLEECFQDQTKHISAIETGLSSDPPMNWRLSKLDRINLVSFSDAHSFWPWRLGREATIFDIKPTYKELINAIRTGNGLIGTIEVDPSYGKYHFDGHRACNVRLAPKESMKIKNICPVCKKPLTIGVLHRVEELADRPEQFIPENAKKFFRIIPLSELIAHYSKSAVNKKDTWNAYFKYVNAFGTELNVLLKAPFEALCQVGSKDFASIIIRNREGKIPIEPGFDGVYGYPVFDPEELKEKEDLSLITAAKAEQKDLKEFFS